MLTDFYVPEPSKHLLSAKLSVAVLVAVALAVLAGYIAFLFLRKDAEDDSVIAEWTDRQVFAEPLSAPQPDLSAARHAASGFAASNGNAGRHFADESPTREIRVDGSWSA